MRSAQERFWDKVTVSAEAGACWLWNASVSNKGYGKIGRGGRGSGWMPAHRVSYEIHFGAIPDSLFVCHRCDNPRCVNPAHLFLGTQFDNMRDAAAKGRTVSPFAGVTHCKRGHEFTDENTRVFFVPRGKGVGRACRACDRERSARAQEVA